jgi:hypothetical protein
MFDSGPDLLRIGDLDAASQVFGDANERKEAALLKPLISMSDGRFADAKAKVLSSTL